VLHGVLDPDLHLAPRRPVADLDDPVGEPLADHDDRRDADQLGVLELHARGHLRAVVVQHRDALAAELLGDARGGLEDRRVLAGGDQVHVRRSDLPRPDQPDVVGGALGDRGDQS
jgi:hypothetical protein